MSTEPTGFRKLAPSAADGNAAFPETTARDTAAPCQCPDPVKCPRCRLQMTTVTTEATPGSAPHTHCGCYLYNALPCCKAGHEKPPATATVEWEMFPFDPSRKGCGECREDALGARVGIRPKIEGLTPAGQIPEGIVVRVCSNCGHITTMGPIRPDIAAEWPVRND